MPKIDTSTIQGYAEMTAEQKLAALETFEYDDKSADVKRYKDAVTKASGEAAEFKRQLNAKMSDEERTKAENDAAFKAMQERLDAYEKREKISGAKSVFMENGCTDGALADTLADAFVSGDAEKLAPALKKYAALLESATKSKLIDNTPVPESGTPEKEMTKDEILKIKDDVQRLSAIEDYMRSHNGTW